MRRLAFTLLAGCMLVGGCDLYYEPGQPRGTAADAAPAMCPPGGPTATILEPVATQPAPSALATRVRWEPLPLGRYTSMSDRYSNFFVPFDHEELAGDIHVDYYDLPAGGSFVFEVGTWCHLGGDEFLEQVLARVEFTTAL